MENTITCYDLIESFKQIKYEQMIMGYRRADVFTEDGLREYCFWFFDHLIESLCQKNIETICSFFNGLPESLKSMSETDFVYMIENHDYKKISSLVEDITKYIIDTV